MTASSSSVLLLKRPPPSASSSPTPPVKDSQKVEISCEKPDQGEVIAVGPGKRDEAGRIIALDVKVGDRVLFGKYSGQTVKVDGEELLVMREEDIMGVLA